MPLNEIARGFSGFIVDLDGVIYLRHELVDGAPEFVAGCRSDGKDLVFLTNNSSRTRDQYVDRLDGFGIPAAKSSIVTSAYATARYLRDRSPGSRVFVVGQEGLIEELRNGGMEIVENGPADFVVAGIDNRFNYGKLETASTLIRSGARFIATNPDATFPTERGPFPGAGSIVKAIETASGQPPTVIGKPNRWILDISLDAMDGSAQEVAIIGDRMETDIKGGLDAGLKTILVLSGVTTREQVRNSDLKPDHTLNSIADLVE